jgi:FAD/FMN-containing dehydrogenase/Fe-S oxidoreductase
MNDTFLQVDRTPDKIVDSFLKALARAGFTGTLNSDFGSRIAYSTDNSIYQIMPQAVVAPKGREDVRRLMELAARPEFESLKFYPRGGGTSTNGQSLGPGIIVDMSRFMRRVLNYDPKTGIVRVEPGLVRDKLNDFLAPYGRFFAPNVSTTNRATIGGMVSNDSSGKGSVVYGKTSDHVESIEMALPRGAVLEFAHVAAAELAGLQGDLGEIARGVDRVLAACEDEILGRLPNMKRGFTGYNLREVRRATGDLNLPKLVSGSEGTLGLITSITLRTKPIPKNTVLAVLIYPNHKTGLMAVPDLLKWRPNAIEFIDDKILDAALRSSFARDVRDILGIDEGRLGMAAYFFEMSGDDPATLEKRLEAFSTYLTTLPHSSPRPVRITVLRDALQIAQVWEIRRACQGLLAGFDENKRAVAFIEDCAVPPENLVGFVRDLEDLLRRQNIPSGMYGHADVGCIHIRPLMNLNSEDERRQIRVISDAVFELTRKHGGLLWGEHGKGFRGEYSETVIGSVLYMAMRRIKGLFDPQNRMNPGKLACPPEEQESLIDLDAVGMRGAFDEQIAPAYRADFSGSLRCDGNGACLNQDETQALCPSYKATSDTRFSPKTRAGLLREWARLRSLDGNTIELERELKDNLGACLSCKSCAGAGCPTQVDIPQMKAMFLEQFYYARPRPFQDHVVASLERLIPALDRAGAGIVNPIISSAPVKFLVEKWLGLTDLPALRSRRRFRQALDALGVRELPPHAILALPESLRARSVVIVQDLFTSYFDSDVVLAQLELVQKLGFDPILLSYREGGKPLHVKGFLRRFRQVAARVAHDLASLHQAGFTCIGVDASTTLMYRNEYFETMTNVPKFSVLLLSEWLKQVNFPKQKCDQEFTLIQHCTERSVVPETSSQWAFVFAKAGIRIHIVKAGCCGMSGLFGHEVARQDMSHALYDQTWRGQVEYGGNLIATGYSCRSQIMRLSNVRALHPAQVLVANWSNKADGSSVD